ncbi:MAG: hypothetical protein ABI877_08355, partial [Gemmatimonadaceae bacterium]
GLEWGLWVCQLGSCGCVSRGELGSGLRVVGCGLWWEVELGIGVGRGAGVTVGQRWVLRELWVLVV